MNFERYNLDTCHQIEGVAVVVDVLRAFTTAAFVFQAGAEEIILTDTVEEAFRLRDEHPGSLLMGEVNGYPIDGFDHSNSPSSLQGAVLAGRTLIQRTSAGTQMCGEKCLCVGDTRS